MRVSKHGKIDWNKVFGHSIILKITRLRPNNEFRSWNTDVPPETTNPETVERNWGYKLTAWNDKGKEACASFC